MEMRHTAQAAGTDHGMASQEPQLLDGNVVLLIEPSCFAVGGAPGRRETQAQQKRHVLGTTTRICSCLCGDCHFEAHLLSSHTDA